MVESFSINSSLIVDSGNLRLDANNYNHEVISALEALDNSGMNVVDLGSMAERVFIPNRFARNYVGAAHGVPFLHGRHIVQFRPDDLKYLSAKTHTAMDALRVHEGWILVTRSGTVGRVAIVTSQWDGWAATEDLYRVVLKKDAPVGYIAAFLGSPLGSVQLTQRPFGAVIDHLTERDIRNVKVPMPRTKAQRTKVQKIGEQAMEAAKRRAAAVDLAEQAEAGISALLPEAEPLPTDAEITRDTPLRIDADPDDALRAMLKPVKRRAAQ